VHSRVHAKFAEPGHSRIAMDAEAARAYGNNPPAAAETEPDPPAAVEAEPDSSAAAEAKPVHGTTEQATEANSTEAPAPSEHAEANSMSDEAAGPKGGDVSAAALAQPEVVRDSRALPVTPPLSPRWRAPTLAASAEDKVAGHALPAAPDGDASKATSAEHVVADSIFSKLAGPNRETISLAEIADYLVAQEVPLDKVVKICQQLDTNADEGIDRAEWRAGFAAGMVRGS